MTIFGQCYNVLNDNVQDNCCVLKMNIECTILGQGYNVFE